MSVERGPTEIRETWTAPEAGDKDPLAQFQSEAATSSSANKPSVSAKPEVPAETHETSASPQTIPVSTPERNEQKGPVGSTARPPAPVPTPPRTTSTPERRAPAAREIEPATTVPPPSDVQRSAPQVRFPISLDEVRTRLGQLHWPEAVAIVAAVCDELTAGPASSASVTDMSDVLIAPTGEVTIRPQVTSARSAEPLARMLHGLSGTANLPVPVRLLATKWIGAPKQPVEQFAAELKYFARPDGPALIQAVYARAAAVPVTSKRSQPVRKAAPQRQAAARPHQLPRWPAGSRLWSQIRTWRPPTAVLTTGAICIALVIGAFALPRNFLRFGEIVQHASAPQLAVEDSAEPSGDLPEAELPEQETSGPSTPDIESTVGAGGSIPPVQQPEPLARVQRPGSRPDVRPPQPSERTAPPEPEPSSVSRTSAMPSGTPQQATSQVSGRAAVEFLLAHEQFDRGEYAAAASGFQHVITLLRDSEQTEGSSTLRSSAIEMARRSRDAFVSTDDTRVYTSLDTDVLAPVPLGQFFPEAPAETSADASVLEIVIDRRGAVESVRLQNPQNSFRDKWWLPAAKAWRFQPAMKDGQPVKFLERIVISP